MRGAADERARTPAVGGRPAGRMRRAAGALCTACALVLLAGALPAAATAATDVIQAEPGEDHGLLDHSEYCTGEGAFGERCPLRAAVETAGLITAAGSGVTEIEVLVPAGVYTLNPSKGPLVVGSAQKACGGIACPVRLQGMGATATKISGGGATRVIHVPAGVAEVTLAGVSIEKGSAETDGVGVLAESPLLVSHARVLENVQAKPLYGGGIAATSTLTLLDSLIEGNYAEFGGGVFAGGPTAKIARTSFVLNEAGISGGGALSVDTSTAASIYDSTFAENVSRSVGGALAVRGTAALRFSTVTGNKADPEGGGALYAEQPVSLEGSILEGNTGGPQCSLPAKGSVVSEGPNIIFGAACAVTGTAPLAVDPLLGPLAGAGAEGPVRVPLRQSPALDAGGAGCPGAALIPSGPLDERGFARPQGAGCDLGAVEAAGDLGLSLQAPATVTLGASVPLTEVVRNTGLEAMSGISVSLPLPAGSSFGALPAGCLVTIVRTGESAVCNLPPLAAGSQESVTVPVLPRIAGRLSAFAGVAAEQPDVNAANDNAAASVLVLSPIPSPPAPTAAAALLSRTLPVDGHGVASARVRCVGSLTGFCFGVLDLYAAGRPRHGARATLYAAARVVVPAGATASVRLRLSRAALRMLSRRGRLAARTVLSVGPSAGAIATSTQTASVTLVRARRRH